MTAIRTKKRVTVTAPDAATASKLYSALRDESYEGASTFPDGVWEGNRISYNGRVWAGKSDDAECIYPKAV